MYVIKNLKCPSYFTLLCGWPFIFHVSFLPSCFYLKQSTETAFVKSFLVFSWLCCCSASKPCLTLCDLMDCSTLGLPVFDYLPVFPQTLVPWIHLQCGRPWFDSWVRKIHWRRVRIPTPVFLGFPCGSDGKESTCNAEDLSSIPELGRSPGGRRGNPFLVFLPGEYSWTEMPGGLQVTGSQKVRHDWVTFTSLQFWLRLFLLFRNT